MEIFYINKKIQKFIESLEKPEKAKTDRIFFLLGDSGKFLNMPYSKALGRGLFELRITGKNQIRFVYTFHFGRVWILHGFVKKTESISKHDLDHAFKQLKLLQ